jgi:hypothetical protein
MHKVQDMDLNLRLWGIVFYVKFTIIYYKMLWGFTVNCYYCLLLLLLFTVIYNIKETVPEQYVRMLYCALVHPFIIYCIISWGFTESGALT